MAAVRESSARCRAADGSGLPLLPTLIQHGTRDEVALISQVRRFRAMMVQAGNDCVLLEYEGAGHVFHYPGPAGHFDGVIGATAEFLFDRLAV